MGELSDVGHYISRAYAKKEITVLLKVLQLEITVKIENKSEMAALTKYLLY